MDTVQILLVGGRQAPNVIGTLLLHSGCVELVVSQDEQAKVKDLIESLKGLSNLRLPKQEDWKIVDAHSYQECVLACQALLSRHPGKVIQFNLTGGTKIMAFAAYDVARLVQAKAFYINTAKAQIVWLVGEKETTAPFRLKITDYLAAYGRQSQRTFDFDKLSFDQSQAVDVARLLAQGGRTAAELLHRIRAKQGSGSRTISLREPLAEHPIASALVGKGSVDQNSKGIVIRSNEDWNFFKGDWLEVYAWDEARNQVDIYGQSVFDECFLGLEIPSDAARKEIDVACLYRAQLIHCSCKTDKKPFETTYLDEMTAVSSLIGGRFCSRVFITNATFPDSKKRNEFLAQAKQREIVVVTGDDLPKLGSILIKQAEKPDYQRV